MSAPYYDDEWVALYHGDCREVEEWRSATALVTDPPYGLGDKMQGGPEWSTLWSGKANDGRSRPLAWDAVAPNDIPEIAAQFDTAIVWGGNYFAMPPSRGWLVWDKVVRNFTSGHCELAWTSLDQPVRAFNFSHGQLATEGKDHPTQKPVSLMEWCVRFTPDAAVVADPFAGTGTTLLAAKTMGRKAIGVELDERYCEIIAKRLSQGVLDFGGVA